jgi:hypothetical protein
MALLFPSVFCIDDSLSGNIEEQMLPNARSTKRAVLIGVAAAVAILGTLLWVRQLMTDGDKPNAAVKPATTDRSWERSSPETRSPGRNPFRGRSMRLTPDWTVASGRHHRYKWRFEAALRSLDGKVTPCPGFGVDPLGGFGGCDITITRGGNIAYDYVSFGKPQLSAVFGSVLARVESVVIELSSGERVEAEMFAIPRRFDDELGNIDFRLFLIFPIPQNAERAQGTVLAINGRGEVMERIPLCSPTSDPPLSTCGN